MRVLSFYLLNWNLKSFIRTKFLDNSNKVILLKKL